MLIFLICQAIAYQKDTYHLKTDYLPRISEDEVIDQTKKMADFDEFYIAAANIALIVKAAHG